MKLINYVSSKPVIYIYISRKRHAVIIEYVHIYLYEYLIGCRSA